MSDRRILDNLLTCDEVEELLPLFALGALDADESMAVAAHLPLCPACSAELVRYESVTGLLGTAVAPIAPSPGLRQELLDRAVDRPRDNAESMPANVVSIAKPRTSTWRNWALAAAALLVMTAGGLGYWVNSLMDERDDARTTASTLAQFVAPDAVAMPMDPMPASEWDWGSGQGMMMKDAAGQMIVVVKGCPPSTDDRTYKVWVGEGEKRVVLGDMVISDDGSGWMPVAMPAEMPAPEILGVSIIEGSEPLADLFIGQMTG